MINSRRSCTNWLPLPLSRYDTTAAQGGHLNLRIASDYPTSLPVGRRERPPNPTPQRRRRGIRPVALNNPPLCMLTPDITTESKRETESGCACKPVIPDGKVRVEACILRKACSSHRDLAFPVRRWVWRGCPMKAPISRLAPTAHCRLSTPRLAVRVAGSSSLQACVRIHLFHPCYDRTTAERQEAGRQDMCMVMTLCNFWPLVPVDIT
jgi:hypothetical protein